MLSYVALFMIFVLVIAFTASIVFLGSLPGKIARQRNHPWPDAVNAASWIGLATGALWPVAFVWSFLPIPQRAREDGSSGARPISDSGTLEKRVVELEKAIDELRSQSQEKPA